MVEVKPLPRSTRKDPKRVSWMIERERKTQLETLATNAGVSAAVFVEWMIDHVQTELDHRGVPSWVPQPEPNDVELPIDSA